MILCFMKSYRVSQNSSMSWCIENMIWFTRTWFIHSFSESGPSSQQALPRSRRTNNFLPRRDQPFYIVCVAFYQQKRLQENSWLQFCTKKGYRWQRMEGCGPQRKGMRLSQSAKRGNEHRILKRKRLKWGWEHQRTDGGAGERDKRAHWQPLEPGKLWKTIKAKLLSICF